LLVLDTSVEADAGASFKPVGIQVAGDGSVPVRMSVLSAAARLRAEPFSGGH
jgi:hypothetical protein